MLKDDADARYAFEKILLHIKDKKDKPDALKDVRGWALDMVYDFTGPHVGFGAAMKKDILHIRTRLKNLSKELDSFATDIRRVGMIVAPDGGCHSSAMLLQCLDQTSFVVKHYYLDMMTSPDKRRGDVMAAALGLLSWLLYWDNICKPEELKEACALAKLALNVHGYDIVYLKVIDTQRETGNILKAIRSDIKQFGAVGRSLNHVEQYLKEK